MHSVLLDTVGKFSDSERILFEKELRCRHINKNEILLGKGEIATSVFFNVKGLLFQHKQKDDDVSTIVNLHLENEWVLNHKSFIIQEPADSCISSYTGGLVIELSIESIHHLIGCSLSFLQLNKIMDSAVSRVHFFDNDSTPVEKYLYILNNRPQLIQAFPLKMIASYLKITPETLSRVREKVTRSQNIS